MTSTVVSCLSALITAVRVVVLMVPQILLASGIVHSSTPLAGGGGGGGGGGGRLAPLPATTIQLELVSFGCAQLTSLECNNRLF